jgi:hypothetical protein
MGHTDCGKPLHLNNSCCLRQLPFSMISDRSCCVVKTNAELFDLGRRHRRSVRGDHLCKVFRKCVHLLLQEEKGCTDDTQLSFVNDKGELRHGVGLTSELILSRYWRMRRKQGARFKNRSQRSGWPGHATEPDKLWGIKLGMVFSPRLTKAQVGYRYSSSCRPRAAQPGVRTYFSAITKLLSDRWHDYRLRRSATHQPAPAGDSDELSFPAHRDTVT